MNKVILSGRLTKDPEIRYSQSTEPVAITRFSIAVNRRFKRDGEPDADFFNCVAFGKNGEFISKYFTKGKMIGIVGSIRNNSWTDNNGQKRVSTEIFVEEAEFLESKAPEQVQQSTQNNNDYYSVEENTEDEDCPF